MPANTDVNAKKKSGSKKKSKLAMILMIILDIVIILAAFGAVFYYIFYNNIGGVTEKYYATVKKIPVLNLALPEPPDPLNPKYMTQAEIKERYIEFKNENEQLKKQLAEAETREKELQVFKDDHDKLSNEAQMILQNLKAREEAIKEKEKQLEEMQLKIEESIMKGDTQAFREFFESIDPENAAILYEEAVKKQQIDESVKKFAQVYAEMEPASAAAIFEQLGASKLDMIAETLRAMNREAASQILQSMTPDFAADVTERLDALYRGN